MLVKAPLGENILHTRAKTRKDIAMSRRLEIVGPFGEHAVGKTAQIAALPVRRSRGRHPPGSPDHFAGNAPLGNPQGMADEGSQGPQGGRAGS